MVCPFCSHLGNKVTDSRMSGEGNVIRRRRHCLECGRRFTTYERIDEIPYMVVKRDGRRERFDRQKVLQGLLRACEKRPIPPPQLQAMVTAAEALVIDSDEMECPTQRIGELLMSKLRRIDRVAYIRFASVYRDFQDEQQFVAEVRRLKVG